MERVGYEVVVVGGGHAGVEAAWAAANLLGIGSDRGGRRATVGLITLRRDTVGVMSCNPAIGGLAKGQIVREIDALGGLMGLAADASGLSFKMLNTSKGPAVHGPRAQCDRHVYRETVLALVESRDEIDLIEGAVEGFEIEKGASGDRVIGVRAVVGGRAVLIECGAAVLTTGTFMRGLMHTGESKTPGGRYGEQPATGISAELLRLGFELGRLKTGTPPRLDRRTIAWDELEDAPGDAEPMAFSELHARGVRLEKLTPLGVLGGRFPVLEQIPCKQTRTTGAIHEHIRANIHRAPMFSGQIESIGPRYCPSIEDKVVRFADRDSHGVFLEPESLRDDFVYCNGIATSLPTDVQDAIVRGMPGCERAAILRYGYAVEYDMVRPHQILATGETKRLGGLFLAGQINGTSGYEEAAGQGLVAGINAARRVRGGGAFVLGRDEAYLGVLMDDLVTKTPTEPYRMFTSRAEHRLLLRADNAVDRLTPRAIELGLLDSTDLGRARRAALEARAAELAALGAQVDAMVVEGAALSRVMQRPEFGFDEFRAAVGAVGVVDRGVALTVFASRNYEPYLRRQESEIRRQRQREHRAIPRGLSREALGEMRPEAREALLRFTPATFGQASRLEGITPADLTLLAVILERRGRGFDQSGAA